VRTSAQHESEVKTSAHEPRGRTNVEHEPVVRTSAHEPRAKTAQICCFSAKHVVLRSKRKDWLARSVVRCLPVDCCFSELKLKIQLSGTSVHH
jgi:hypothetical protein